MPEQIWLHPEVVIEKGRERTPEPSGSPLVAGEVIYRKVAVNQGQLYIRCGGRGNNNPQPETAEQQIDRLAKFIMESIPGEPSQSEGAVDTAIRLLGIDASRLEHIGYVSAGKKFYERPTEKMIHGARMQPVYRLVGDDRRKEQR